MELRLQPHQLPLSQRLREKPCPLGIWEPVQEAELRVSIVHVCKQQVWRSLSAKSK